MAFNVKAPAYFQHTLKQLPGSASGEPQSMDITYRVVPDDAARVDLADEQATTDFVISCVHDIADLVAEDGTSIPCTDEMLRELCRSTHLRLALARGYGIGLAKAMTGN